MIPFSIMWSTYGLGQLNPTRKLKWLNQNKCDVCSLFLLQSSSHPETSALLLSTVLIKEPENGMDREVGINGQGITSY